MTRNSEIGNTPVCVLPNIWRLGQVRELHFARIFLIKCYWMLQNVRVLAFTVSDLLMENQQGSKSTPNHPELD